MPISIGGTPKSDMSISKQIKFEYDQGNRSHLTRAPGSVN
jgi:hypothetical protein